MLVAENLSTWRLFRAQCDFVRDNTHGRLGAPERVACYQKWMAECSLQVHLNEVYLFHGTNPKVVPLIKRQGFETRLPPASGRMLGDGVYFAENASKSDQYGVPVGTNKFFLFVARVCLGTAFKTDESHSSLKRPPEVSAGGRLFDSVVYSKSGKHREFVVYDRCACYPEFLVEYSRV